MQRERAKGSLSLVGMREIRKEEVVEHPGEGNEERGKGHFSYVLRYEIPPVIVSV